MRRGGGGKSTKLADQTRYRNIGFSLRQSASHWPNQIAIAEPARPWEKDEDAVQATGYRTVSFADLDRDTDQLASAMMARGLRSGMRVALLVPPSIDFMAFTFALFKAGAVIVLVDPGMGRRNMISCLSQAGPEGFVGVPLAQAARSWFHRQFPAPRLLVTVGWRGWWGGTTAAQLRADKIDGLPPKQNASPADAAIIFTTGSTGPPKGVLYSHENFLQQVTSLQTYYNISAGSVDVPCFPLFALFNLAMGVTTVIPRMDPTRPAKANPRHILQAIHVWEADQAFASPALWNVVGRFCEKHNVRIPTLKRVLSAGAPVPPHVLRRMKNAIGESGCVHTPYGATEALPVASISDREVLEETQHRSAKGHGTCVGNRFPGIEWMIIPIQDAAIPSLDKVESLPLGNIGELIVRGPVVTREYVTRTEMNDLAKIRDGDQTWHRMGDVGYLDERERFWFCGRKSHRIETAEGTLFTIPCEAIANGHPRVYRSALVPIGPLDRQLPALVVECWPEHRIRSRRDARQLQAEIFERLQEFDLTQSIMLEHILFRRSLPVDIRHNAKIFREKLAVWANRKLKRTLNHTGRSDN